MSQHLLYTQTPYWVEQSPACWSKITARGLLCPSVWPHPHLCLVRPQEGPGVTQGCKSPQEIQ